MSTCVRQRCLLMDVMIGALFMFMFVTFWLSMRVVVYICLRPTSSRRPGSRLGFWSYQTQGRVHGVILVGEKIS